MEMIPQLICFSFCFPYQVKTFVYANLNVWIGNHHQQVGKSRKIGSKESCNKRDTKGKVYVEVVVVSF
jgi:hypothetical protein